MQTGAATKTGGITNIETVTGGNAQDTLIGPNVVSDWALTGTDEGIVNGTFSFRSFENLTGGTQIDTFHVNPGASVSGTLKGGGGADVLDYSAFGGPVTVNLASSSATGVGTFSSIAGFVGSAATDTLIGADKNNTWSLTAAGGTVAGVAFSSFESLLGGSAADTFRIGEGVTFGGEIRGGAGVDTLDYSGRTTGVLVNLMTGTATGVALVAGIENVTGGAGNDTLIGDAGDNVLSGGAGNDVLAGTAGSDTLTGGDGRDLAVGGAGADLLHGNGDEDILIGGSLGYVNEATGAVNQAALDALMAEWTRTDLAPAARIAHLNGSVSGGLNEPYVLNGSTVFDDGLVDTLYGDGGTDWFLASLVDDIHKTSGEVVEII